MPVMRIRLQKPDPLFKTRALSQLQKYAYRNTDLQNPGGNGYLAKVQKGGTGMKRLIVIAMVLIGVGVYPQPTRSEDHLSQADALFDQGGLPNFKRAIELYQKALAADPDRFDLYWKCARSYREYGETAKRNRLENWEKICAEFGKAGMNMAEKAIALAPEKIEGHYYYGLNVGIYSDGVSILTALREGLKGKTQKSFEKSYALDKMYDEAGPVLSLGRFWAVVPWPFKDKKKALEYYREFQKTPYFDIKPDAQIYLAELLLKMKGKGNKEAAETLLKKASRSNETYFRDWATDLLSTLKKSKKANKLSDK
jgi:tetratricopeptide (TPR) repeat protein